MTCRFFWGTTDEQEVIDRHGDPIIVLISLMHTCGQESENHVTHICSKCTNTYYDPPEGGTADV